MDVAAVAWQCSQSTMVPATQLTGVNRQDFNLDNSRVTKTLLLRERSALSHPGL